MSSNQTIIVVTDEGMGKGEVELKQSLISNYFININGTQNMPDAICFYSEGVKLTVKDSIVLNELKSLEQKGVKLLVCSTSLNYYKLSDRLRVGKITNMPEIMNFIWNANKVIYL
ncbi:MAG: DsrE family protein [Leptospiraceae bacterium]|nr:DsrE family protein [Leptospiraceae bacterium]MCP5495354.1 DsrE family protein [Leptospiraceae bacterium]